MQNPQRMMRALEVKLATGDSILDFHSGKKITREFEIKKINLEIPRDDLYERINTYRRCFLPSINGDLSIVAIGTEY